MAPCWHCWGPVGCALQVLPVRQCQRGNHLDLEGQAEAAGPDRGQGVLSPSIPSPVAIGDFVTLGTVTLWSRTSTVGETHHPITHVPKERAKPPWEQAWTASLWEDLMESLDHGELGNPQHQHHSLARLAVSHQLQPRWMELPGPGASLTPRNPGSILFFSFSPCDTHPMAYPNVSRRCQLLVDKCILGKKLKQKKNKKKGKKIFNLSLVTIYINI